MPTRKIYTNTLAQIGGKVLTAIISIGMIKVLTGYLDIDGYGLYSKIYNYLSIFAVIADLGLYTITVRELSAHQHDKKMVDTIASNVLTLRTISGALIILFSLSIGYFLDGYNSPEAMIGIAITSLFTLLGLINSSLMSYLQAFLKTEFSIIANTAGKLLTLGMIMIFAAFFTGIVHTERFILVMTAGLAGNILMTALTWWYAKKSHRIHFGWDTKYIRHILKISLPYGVALFLNVIFFKVDTILLSIMEPHHIADRVIALYSLPMKIVEVGMMYGTVFLNSLLPVLTNTFTQEEGQGLMQEEKKSTHLIENAYTLLLFFGVGISLFLSIMRESVIRIISTESFVMTELYGFTSIDAMNIVVWIFLFYFISSLAIYILIARGRQKSMMYINAGIALLNIIGNIIIIPHYSFIGSAIVTLMSQICLMIATCWLVRKDLRPRPILENSFFILILGLIAGFVIMLFQSFFPLDDGATFLENMIHIFFGLSIFSLLYIGGFSIFRKYRSQKKVHQY